MGDGRAVRAVGRSERAGVGPSCSVGDGVSRCVGVIAGVGTRAEDAPVPDGVADGRVGVPPTQAASSSARQTATAGATRIGRMIFAAVALTVCVSGAWPGRRFSRA